jgi:hypothetical protein
MLTHLSMRYVWVVSSVDEFEALHAVDFHCDGARIMLAVKRVLAKQPIAFVYLRSFYHSLGVTSDLGELADLLRDMLMDDDPDVTQAALDAQRAAAMHLGQIENLADW